MFCAKSPNQTDLLAQTMKTKSTSHTHNVCMCVSVYLNKQIRPLQWSAVITKSDDFAKFDWTAIVTTAMIQLIAVSVPKA